MTYVFSDAHGEYDLTRRLLDAVRFSSSDTLIFCGDAVDKGPDSVKLLQFLFSLPNAVIISGNHEYDFIKYYHALMSTSPSPDEALDKLQSYFMGDGNLLTWEMVDALESLPFYYETESFLCVHAGAPLDKDRNILPLSLAAPEQLVYDRDFKQPGVVPRGKCVFFGHTPTSALGYGSKIVAYKKRGTKGDKISDYVKVHLDTGVYLGGVLGCFRVEDCKVFYVER